MKENLSETKVKLRNRRRFALFTITLSLSALVLSTTINTINQTAVPYNVNNLPQFLYCEARAVDRTIRQIPSNYKLALHVTLPMLFKRCKERVFDWE